MLFEHKRSRGITLVELMITVAIVAILAAVGYPSYMEHVKSTRRGEAKATLLELAQFMERKFSADGCYKCGSETITLPFTQAPKDGGTAYYTLSLASTPAVSGTTFTLQAVPTGVMSGDSCGTYTVDQTGTHSPVSTTCW
jgi:type IV pilus assembly protein PilE